MKIADITKIIEGTIFVSGEGVDKDEFKRIYDLSDKELNKCLDALKEKYNEDSGINLITYKNKIQLCSNPKYADNIAEILNPIRERSLTKAALETVAIVAYKQPITRTEIEQIRGVNCDYAVQLLQSNNLIEVVGRKDAVGKPLLFGTTEDFLKRFELNSLDELPNHKELLDRIRVIHSEGDSLYREFTIPDENAEENAENSNNVENAENSDNIVKTENTENVTENITKSVENGVSDETNEGNIKDINSTNKAETNQNIGKNNSSVEAKNMTENTIKSNENIEINVEPETAKIQENVVQDKPKTKKTKKKIEINEAVEVENSIEPQKSSIIEEIEANENKTQFKEESILVDSVKDAVDEDKFSLDNFEMPVRKNRRKNLIENLVEAKPVKEDMKSAESIEKSSKIGKASVESKISKENTTEKVAESQTTENMANQPAETNIENKPKLSWQERLKMRLAEQANQQE